MFDGLDTFLRNTESYSRPSKVEFKTFDSFETIMAEKPDGVYAKQILEENWSKKMISQRVKYLQEIYDSNIGYISKAIDSFGMDTDYIEKCMSYIQQKNWELAMAVIRAYKETSSGITYYNTEEGSKSHPLIFWEKDRWEYNNRDYSDKEIYLLLTTVPFHTTRYEESHLNLSLLQNIVHNSKTSGISADTFAEFDTIKKELIEKRKNRTRNRKNKS